MDSFKFITKMSLHRLHLKEIEKILQQSESVMSFSLSAFSYLTNNAYNDLEDQMICDIIFDISSAVFSDEDKEKFFGWWQAWENTFIRTSSVLGI